ncbi:MAG TPA: VOC family protein [Devosia sp.]|jgi:hypothetical protein|uniref:VOC family protein n=1 Tax=Devosia sp. TaxID=1871048 RepID=UPI002DDCC6CD|nr:VOC family protein [Devosia sp.]HEV2515769.1 VOC family protein [Devosia sp.]
MSEPVFRSRVHLIALGVADVARSAAFYEALGWQRAPTSHAGFVKFDLGGMALALISKVDLAADALARPGDPGASSSLALIYCADQPDDVARLLAQAERAGGTIVKPATRTQWGTAGYFRDPDGHLFEIDHEDGWVFDGEHRLVV